MKKRDIMRYLKLFILLAPILIICCTLLGQGTMSITSINSALPTHQLLNNVSTWLRTNLNFTLGDYGLFALNYGAYIILVEMVEVIMNMLLCIPRIVNKYLAGD